MSTDLTSSDSPSPGELRTLFCERFKCPPSQFEARALRKCLYLHARMLAPVLRRLDRTCFERDLVFISYFGRAKNFQEVATEVAALHYQDAIKPRFARNELRLRISGHKANKLAAKLFPAFNPAEARMSSIV